MSRPRVPGGAGPRRPNGSGYIKADRLACGEMRYRVWLRNAYLGSFRRQQEALRAVERAKASVSDAEVSS